MKLNIKNWFLGNKKENYSQILEKVGRIAHLEKKVIRQEKMIRGIQSRMNRLWAENQKQKIKMPKKA